MRHNIGLYLRVSTDEQALRQEGSLDSQKHRLQAYVDIKNVQDEKKKKGKKK
jgi:DNA invertase Pin-like site-specific DNA recombinase